STIATALFLLLAACGPKAGETDRSLPAIHAAFDHSLPDTLVVEIADPSSLADAELIAPDGTTIPAFRIDRDETVHEGSPSPAIAVGVAGGNASGVGTTIGIGIPIFGWGDQARPLTRSTAHFKVADMPLYRTSWQHWTIRLSLPDRQGLPRTFDIAAPAPF